MLAPLTTETVATLLGQLHIAFPRNLGMQNPGRMAEIYYTGLRGLPAESVRWAVQRTLEEDQFFPKIARLREFAHAWTKRNSFLLNRHVTTDPYECSVCGAQAKQIPITRTQRQWVGEPPTEKLVDVLDADGRPILETVLSQGLVMVHDRYRHGLTQSGEQEMTA